MKRLFKTTASVMTLAAMTLATSSAMAKSRGNSQSFQPSNNVTKKVVTTPFASGGTATVRDHRTTKVTTPVFPLTGNGTPTVRDHRTTKGPFNVNPIGPIGPVKPPVQPPIDYRTWTYRSVLIENT
jgi:hypothetical protein